MERYQPNFENKCAQGEVQKLMDEVAFYSDEEIGQMINELLDQRGAGLNIDQVRLDILKDELHIRKFPEEE